MLNLIPVDNARLGQTELRSVSPKTDQSGEQRKNRDDVLQWTVTVIVSPPAREDGYTPKETIEDVTIAAPQAPKVSKGTPVNFGNLTARPYEFNGRSGITLSADSVTPAQPTREG